MGWNDHVEFIAMECLDCGAVDDWEFWDDTGRHRYSGAMGALVNVDVSRHGKCPHCGSTKGEPVEEQWGDGFADPENAIFPVSSLPDDEIPDDKI